MKRTRCDEPSEPESNWSSLVPDVIRHIASFLDPLSRILFSLTDSSNRKLTHVHSDIPLFVMEEALTLHGSLWLIKKYNWCDYRDTGAIAGYAAKRGIWKS